MIKCTLLHIDCFFEYISYFQPHFFSFSFTLLHILMVDTSVQNNLGINVTICALGGRPRFNADISSPRGTW